MEGWRGGETEKRRNGEMENGEMENGEGEKAERVRRFEQGIDYLQQCEIMVKEKRLERICGSRVRQDWLGLQACQDCRRIL
ncbi:MAG: hypothetical protein LBT59_11925 [Clostridiales bacterium]|nr:hypothetical protein [Clostridiales bacterium]